MFSNLPKTKLRWIRSGAPEAGDGVAFLACYSSPLLHWQLQGVEPRVSTNPPWDNIVDPLQITFCSENLPRTSRIIIMAMLRCGRPAPFAIFGMAAVFLIVLFFQLSSNPTINEKLPDWVPTITDFRNGISDTLGTTNIKKMMEKSEKLWQKSVKARHEFRARHPDLDL